MMVCLAGLSTLVDANCVSARIGMGLTTILTVSTLIQSIKSKIPNVSYLTALDIYLWVCFFFVFAATVEYVWLDYWMTSYEEALTEGLVVASCSDENEKDKVKRPPGKRLWKQVKNVFPMILRTQNQRPRSVIDEVFEDEKQRQNSLSRSQPFISSSRSEESGLMNWKSNPSFDFQASKLYSSSEENLSLISEELNSDSTNHLLTDSRIESRNSRNLNRRKSVDFSLNNLTFDNKNAKSKMYQRHLVTVHDNRMNKPSKNRKKQEARFSRRPLSMMKNNSITTYHLEIEDDQWRTVDQDNDNDPQKCGVSEMIKTTKRPPTNTSNNRTSLRKDNSRRMSCKRGHKHAPRAESAQGFIKTTGGNIRKLKSFIDTDKGEEVKENSV